MRFARHAFIVTLTFCLSVCCSTYTFSQPRKPVEVAGGTLSGRKMIFVAESHSITEKSAFYNSLCPYLAEKYGICNVVIEAGHAFAYLVNSYLQHGDTTIIMYNTDSTSRAKLLAIRNMYNSLPAGKKITFYGMDFERMEFAVVVRNILEANKVANSPLVDYIKNIPDSILYKVRMTPTQSELRIEMYGRARELFAAEKATLRNLVTTNFDVLERILENPTLESKFSRRDRGMHKNIITQLKDKPFLCIVGSMHTTYRRHQAYPSLIKLFTRSQPENEDKLTIINLVSNRKYLITPLWSKEGAPQVYTSGKEGPGYFTSNDAAMDHAYKYYVSPGKYTLVHKKVFGDMVRKGNHGLDSYYIFFGDTK
ncbi:MAG: hypothetical protein K9G49_16310 [Taibaiella sp.]|nr:hypothetical protein [Taibaiella sp.]